MFIEKLRILEEEGLLRNIKDRTSPQGPKIRFNGREYLNFSSNDYLGLANNPCIIDAVKKALDMYGFGAGASRLLSGGSILHKELEEKVAGFKDTESALVFNSGYAANTGIIPSIADPDTVLLSDELNHASIIDGCRLSGARTLVYNHKDLFHIDDLLRKEGRRRKIVITDTVFSMDGDIAPLKELYDVCINHGALLYLDEAHSTGVLGNGKGSLAHFSMKPEPWVIQMGTFSKALGSLGAFLAGGADVVQWTMNRARSFTYSTALPSCVIAASIAALGLIESGTDLIDRLWFLRNRAVESIRNIGLDITGSETPIIPVRTGSSENALRISGMLLDKGIYAPAIRPPTVKEPRIRISITAAHSEDNINSLVEALEGA